MPKTDKTRFANAWRVAPALSLSVLLLHASGAEAPLTPGSVRDTLGAPGARLPATPPQVIMPVQSGAAPHNPRAIRFPVNAFDMSGNTVYREALLKRLLDRYTDMELNLHDLNSAADTITEFYHDHGYTLARAYIPAQKVENGVVRMQIVEGRFGRVSFTGNKRYSTDFLAARTQLFKPGTLVTTDRLENNLLLLNDLPGLKARAVMQPGAEVGATDAEIQVQEKLVDASLNLNNYGRAETGRNRLEAALSINSPFGWGDQLSLSGSSTQHSLVRYWKLGYSVPLGTTGTRLTIGSSKAAYDVSGNLASLGIRGDIRTDEIAVSHPFVRSRDENQALSVGVKRNRLSQSALGTPVSDQALSVLEANYLVSRIYPDTSIGNLSFGLETNFRSNNETTGQDAVFARMEVDGNYTAPFIGKWDLYLRGDLVHSKERLPDTEKFSLGGPTSVRGFRPSEVRGDSGYLATIEFRHPFTLANRIGSFRLDADAGEAIYKAPGYNDSRDRLRSVGLGATFYPAKGTAASIDIARPVGPYRASDGVTTRIWVNFSASF